MIGSEELAHYVRQLPHGRNAKSGPDYHFSYMGDPYDHMRYDARPYDHYSMPTHCHRISFRVERTRLNGATVWAWTHGDIVVKVDV